MNCSTEFDAGSNCCGVIGSFAKNVLIVLVLTGATVGLLDVVCTAGALVLSGLTELLEKNV